MPCTTLRTTLHLWGIKIWIKCGDLVGQLQCAHLFGNSPKSPCLFFEFWICFWRHFKCIALPQGSSRLDTEPLVLCVDLMQSGIPKTLFPLVNRPWQRLHWLWLASFAFCLFFALVKRLAMASGCWLKPKLFPHEHVFVAAPLDLLQDPQTLGGRVVFSVWCLEFILAWYAWWRAMKSWLDSPSSRIGWGLSADMVTSVGLGWWARLERWMIDWNGDDWNRQNWRHRPCPLTGDVAGQCLIWTKPSPS